MSDGLLPRRVQARDRSVSEGNADLDTRSQPACTSTAANRIHLARTAADRTDQHFEKYGDLHGEVNETLDISCGYKAAAAYCAYVRAYCFPAAAFSWGPRQEHWFHIFASLRRLADATGDVGDSRHAEVAFRRFLYACAGLPDGDAI